jgi:hypothetical protein
VAGSVAVKTYLGRLFQYNVHCALGDFVARVEEGAFEVGENVSVVFPADKLVLIRAGE